MIFGREGGRKKRRKFLATDIPDDYLDEIPYFNTGTYIFNKIFTNHHDIQL